jgi:sugar phosphate isomerase/epimerase
VSFNDIQTKPEAIVEQHRVLECRYPAIGGFHPREGSTREAWAGFARDFRAAGDRLAQDGLTLGYHNHSHELAPFGELTPLELLVSELGPNNWFEIDTYWIAHGGGDPRAWIERVSGRIPCVHFKDMTITPERQQKMCEIGSGNLNWSGIIESCRSAGVEWYLVERDAGDMDPFDSLEVSLNNMREMGL